MFSASYFGKTKRIERLFHNGRLLIVPIDDSLIFGPENGLSDLSGTLSYIVKSNPSAILGFKGAYSILLANNGIDIPFIMNTTASTTMGQHVQKRKICSVQDALVMGVDCVATHINFTSIYENEMLECAANTISEADKFGMPVLAIAYPRTTNNTGEDENYIVVKENDVEAYTKLICHCVRTSAEIGADIIKTQYTGTVQTFKKVIDSALGKPIVIAGGPVLEIEKSYEMARGAMDAGATGISFGRNVFNAKNVEAYLSGIKAIVYDDASVYDALKIYNEVSDNV